MGKKVVIGGTFDLIHEGHLALLKKAFQLGQVFVGLTSDVMVKKTKKRKILVFKKRKKNLAEFIKKQFIQKPRIFKIEDKFGFALKQDFDYIVVSPGSFKNAQLLNLARRKIKKKPIKIIKIKFVMGKDGRPVSSSGLAKRK